MTDGYGLIGTNDTDFTSNHHLTSSNRLWSTRRTRDPYVSIPAALLVSGSGLWQEYTDAYCLGDTVN